MDSYDAVVIGAGFKGMMTAYGLVKSGMSVCIIDKSRELGGFMSPMQWQGVDVDKGPQFLDGISEAHKAILDDIMGDYEPLTELKYSYGTYWNGIYTEGFAIPDYRTLPVQDKALVLLESLCTPVEPVSNSAISDMYSKDMEKSYSYIKNWCNKFLQNNAEDLSILSASLATFIGRKLILDNDLSLILKQVPLLDDIIAARKTTIDHGTYNLYPKDKNLGYFRNAFEEKLLALGVICQLNTEVTEVTRSDGHVVTLRNGVQIRAGAVYCTSTIESTESLFLGTNEITSFISPVAQVFYLLELDLSSELPFYIMNYSDSSISRITNFTAYANKSRNGKSILCVEVPTRIDSDLWENPELHFDTLRNEIEEMGIDTVNLNAHQAFKIPSTYRALLIGYEEKLAYINNAIVDRHGSDIHILTPHLLTRTSIMNDLTSKGVLS